MESIHKEVCRCSSLPVNPWNMILFQGRKNITKNLLLLICESLDSWLTFSCIMFLLTCWELTHFSMGVPELAFAINILDVCCCYAFLSGHKRTSTHCQAPVISIFTLKELLLMTYVLTSLLNIYRNERGIKLRFWVCSKTYDNLSSSQGQTMSGVSRKQVEVLKKAFFFGS